MIVHLSGASLALLSSSLSQRFPVMPYIVEFEVNLSKFKMWDWCLHLSYSREFILSAILRRLLLLLHLLRRRHFALLRRSCRLLLNLGDVLPKRHDLCLLLHRKPTLRLDPLHRPSVKELHLGFPRYCVPIGDVPKERGEIDVFVNSRCGLQRVEDRVPRRTQFLNIQ